MRRAFYRFAGIANVAFGATLCFTAAGMIPVPEGNTWTTERMVFTALVAGGLSIFFFSMVDETHD